jgi:hypothetical protein
MARLRFSTLLTVVFRVIRRYEMAYLSFLKKCCMITANCFFIQDAYKLTKNPLYKEVIEKHHLSRKN